MPKPLWKQDEVFPIVARLISEEYERKRGFVRADDIEARLLEDREAKDVIEAARVQKTDWTVEHIVANMVAWFSQKFTDGLSEWHPSFERAKIGAKWAYRPRKPAQVGKRLRHFIAYHKADERGLLDRITPRESESIGSKKSLNMLRAAIGSRVWLFEGRGTKTGKPIFSLAYSFIAENAEDAPDGQEKQLSGSSVVYFEDEALNDLPWFKRLKIEVANFSLGFQEVKSPEVIAQFEAFLADSDLADFGQQLPTTFTEGGKRRVEISIRERSAAARLACIRHHGAVCFICGFDFGRFYGRRAEGFIEVHHRRQISDASGSGAVDPVSDLVPLCANCHRVVHLLPLIELDALKEELRKRPNQSVQPTPGSVTPRAIE